jgi:hypothetical protein
MFRQDAQTNSTYLLGKSVDNVQEFDLFFAVACEAE